ncbi:MAG: DUF815 domain-containing protein [Pseudomonadota bacterium]
MSKRRDVLERIVTALERLAPALSPPTDWLSAPGYVWTGDAAQPVPKLNALPLATLRGIDQQKARLSDNIMRLAQGAAAHDMLLWGARGMGKSALVLAATAHAQSQAPGRLGLVEITPTGLPQLSRLIAELSQVPRAFVLLLDDLGFGPSDIQANLALRSLLEGGLVQRPHKIRLAVTTNRRAIVSRDPAESEALHERDERDHALALADRFGLALGFHPCGQATYLEIVNAYLAPLELRYDETDALSWASERGSRSGRTAFQFATELAGRAGLSL